MTVLHVDLDNTLIYSYKHDIGNDRINVETYQDREVSFLTGTTYENLKKLKEKLLIVPTSTRSIEQYRRIDLGIGSLPYALVCNGGVLLVNGEKESAWYQVSLQLIRESLPALDRARHFLERDSRRKFELRFIEDLFLFTKCREPENVVMELQETLDTDTADVFHNKEKVYVVPRKLSKGTAVERFRKYLPADRVIAAGDSRFDISMLRAADIGIAPRGFRQEFSLDFSSDVSLDFPLDTSIHFPTDAYSDFSTNSPLEFFLEEMPGNRLFSDEMSERLLELCQKG